jgi:hypothetical protein
MKNIDIQKVMDMLSTMLRCPICGHKYHKDGTRVIESEQDQVFGEAYVLIHSDCQKCKSSIVFSVEIKGPEVFSVGMVTDLTQSDTVKFRKLSAIASSDVLNIHKDIRKFNGNFVKALTTHAK